MSKANVWQFYSDGEWCVGSNRHDHRSNTESGGYPVRDLYTTDHAEELAKALEATNNELTFAMQLYKQDDEDWQKIMRMIVANASIISNYRDATK